MGFFQFRKKETPREQIGKAFLFLESEFGYTLVEQSEQEAFTAPYFWVYRNTAVQIEICGNEQQLHLLFRKIINGEPAAYSNEQYCTGFESLLVLETGNQYNPEEVHPRGPKGLNGALNNVTALLHRHRDVLNGTNWINTAAVNQYSNDNLEEQFGPFTGIEQPVYFDEMVILVKPLLEAKGYTLVLNSKELPPFHKNRHTELLVYQKEARTISIAQSDWRDEYNTYDVLVNNESKLRVITVETATDEAIAQTLATIQQYA